MPRCARPPHLPHRHRPVRRPLTSASSPPPPPPPPPGCRCVFFSPAKRVTLNQLVRNAATLAAGKDLSEADNDAAGSGASGGQGPASSATATSGGVLAGAGGVTAEDVELEGGSGSGGGARGRDDAGWEAAAASGGKAGGRRAAAAAGSSQPAAAPATEATNSSADFDVEASGPEAPGFAIEDTDGGPEANKGHARGAAGANPF